MGKIKDFLVGLVTDRANGINSKIFVGMIFAVVMIVGLFVAVDSSLYNIFALCTMGLLGLSCVDNLTAPKVVAEKKEVKHTKTEIDVKKILDKVKKNELC